MVLILRTSFNLFWGFVLGFWCLVQYQFPCGRKTTCGASSFSKYCMIWYNCQGDNFGFVTSFHIVLSIVQDPYMYAIHGSWITYVWKSSSNAFWNWPWMPSFPYCFQTFCFPVFFFFVSFWNLAAHLWCIRF